MALLRWMGVGPFHQQQHQLLEQPKEHQSLIKPISHPDAKRYGFENVRDAIQYPVVLPLSSHFPFGSLADALLLPTRSGLLVWQYLVSIDPIVHLQLLVLIPCSPLIQLCKFCVASLVLLLPLPRTRLQHPRSLLSLSITSHTASYSVPDRSTRRLRGTFQVCKSFQACNYSLQAWPWSSTCSSRSKGRPLYCRRRRREGRQFSSPDPLALPHPLRRTSLSFPAHCPSPCRQRYHRSHRVHRKAPQRKRTLPQYPAPGCPRIPELSAE